MNHFMLQLKPFKIKKYLFKNTIKLKLFFKKTNTDSIKLNSFLWTELIKPKPNIGAVSSGLQLARPTHLNPKYRKAD